MVSRHNGEEAQQRLQKATATLAHRGPEAQGFWTNEAATFSFGHRRLCIIDLSDAASQPMHYKNRYTLIYNGEIYNYRELKKELEAEGYVFRSQSDTEVVLLAYAAWGDACLQRFDGMFALAIWDEQEQKLFAARDRLGEKPFFFFYDGDRLLFASEIKAFWPMGVKKAVNEAMLYNFLTIGYTTNPTDAEETFYHNIRKLPAAHSLTYSLRENQLHTHCYWQVYIDENKSISEAEAIEGFQHLFEGSIRKRLRSDVAIGTSLSGGLDSSAIVAFCAREATEQYSHKGFTASFEGFEKDETAYASMVAKQYRLQHFTTTVVAEEVPALMDAVAVQQDEPFSSSSALAQYKVFALAKEQGVTVLLDGQGADEILAGYHKYYKWFWGELYRAKSLHRSGELKAAKALGVPERFGLKNKAAALLPDFAASLLQTQKSKEAFRHPHLPSDFAMGNKQNFYYAAPAHLTLNGALHYNTFVNGLEEILRLADRNSMAHSIELRLPFLSPQLVEFLFTLPPRFKIHKGWTKWLLRKVVEEKLPKEIVWRRDKVGFETPQKIWMQNGAVQEKIIEARKTLVQHGVLSNTVLSKAVLPREAHEAESFDWRYWSAAHLF